MCACAHTQECCHCKLIVRLSRSRDMSLGEPVRRGDGSESLCDATDHLSQDLEIIHSVPPGCCLCFKQHAGLDSANFLQKVGDSQGENLSFWVPFSSRCWDSGARLMNGSSS